MDAGCTEPHLGLATTEELMRELIARFEIGHTIQMPLTASEESEVSSSINFLRAQTLWNILYGMNEEDRKYRTVDNG